MIKVGYLISYDYELLFNSIPTVYKEADEIFLAIDKDRRTWAGNNFSLPNTFFERIKELDTQKKITFFIDNFYIPSLAPMENEVRERNMLLKKMGKGWLFQLDSDEYLYDFKSISQKLRTKNYLIKFNRLLPVTLSGYWVILFKKNEEGFFQISNKTKFNFITNYPKYTGARKNKNFVNINIENLAFHQSYAREEDEIYQKIKNWGHKDDFDTDKFFTFWKTINIENYKSIKNFHPEIPNLWSHLEFVKAKNVKELISTSKVSEQLSFDHLNAINIFSGNCKIFFKKKTKIVKKIKRKLYIIYKQPLK
jgi:hypothetical protein|tara:strand:+ start:617 stop:1540 length:924 start_codon:yes stop_codon:yes gene_type:complete